MTTAIEIIKDAYITAGVIGENETLKSGEAQRGLKTLNNMLALWSIDRTYIYAVTQNNFPLTNGVGTYTIGTGGTFNIPRPPTIDYAFVRLNGVDYPLRPIDNQDYDAIPYKPNNGFPVCFYYDAAFPLGTIKIYGTPQANMELFLDTWTLLPRFANLVTDITFPDGYEMALVYNLAKMIVPKFGFSLTPEAQEIAVASLAMVRSRNVPSLVLKTEAAYMTNNFSGPYTYGPWGY